MPQNEYILIVDDDCDIRNLLGIYLENEGYRFIKCDRNSAENISPVLQPPADRGKPAVTRHNINFFMLSDVLVAILTYRPQRSSQWHPQPAYSSRLRPFPKWMGTPIMTGSKIATVVSTTKRSPSWPSR